MPPINPFPQPEPRPDIEKFVILPQVIQILSGATMDHLDVEEKPLFVSSWDLKSKTPDINKAILIRNKGDVYKMQRNIDNFNKKHGEDVRLILNWPCKFGGYNRTDCGKHQRG